MEDISTISHNRTPIDDFQFQFDKKRRLVFKLSRQKRFVGVELFQFFEKLAGIRNAPRETEWIEFGGKFTNNS